MTDESRLGKLESDVQHLQADVTEIKGEVKSLRNAFDLLRTEVLSFKTAVAKEFGDAAKKASFVWKLIIDVTRADFCPSH